MDPADEAGSPSVRSTYMADKWATFGIDLHLDLAGRKVRAGLETALREAVRTGRLSPGTRLPSSRALAADLGVARNTVAEAYGQLIAEGWLSAERGSGTRVAAGPPRSRISPPPPPRRRATRATTCGRAHPTCPPSRAPPGSPRRGGRCWPRPATRSATATRAAARNCGTLWPVTWPGPGGCGPAPTASWCAPASRRDWLCSARSSGPGERPPSRSRRTAWPVQRGHGGGRRAAAHPAAGRWAGRRRARGGGRRRDPVHPGASVPGRGRARAATADRRGGVGQGHRAE